MSSVVPEVSTVSLNDKFGEDDSGVKDASPEEIIPPGLSLPEFPDLLGPMVLCGNLFRSVCFDPLSSQLEWTALLSSHNDRHVSLG